MKKISGVVFYEGPSKINGKPIIGIATGLKNKSVNSKTGDMIQTWILCKNIHPIDAIKNLRDEDICGNCPHRRGTGGACYVNVGQAPANIWKCYKKGNYPKINNDNLQLFKGRKLRMGSYGDPSMIPYKYWSPLIKICDKTLGYTHQWDNYKLKNKVKNFCMASVDNEEEAKKAISKGYRTFRVKKIESPLLKGEFSCPASEEKGKLLTCNQCMACNGGSPPKGSVVISVHGVIKKRFNNYAKIT